MSQDGLPSNCDARLTNEGAEFRLWPETRRWSLVDTPIRVCKGSYGRHSYWLDDEPAARTDIPAHVNDFVAFSFRLGIDELIIEPGNVKLVGTITNRQWKKIMVPTRKAVDRLYEAAPQLVAV